MNTPQNLPEKLRNLDWYAIACKVREKYEKLKEKATNLEKSLVGYQKEIKAKDVIINEQNQDLDAHKETVNKLYRKLEDDTGKIKNQQLLIEKLAQDLKDSQTQRGRLERDCSFLQENYNQLQYQVREKEKENQELNARLQRQQRSTLEYKAALDKYLQSSSTDKPPVTSAEKTTIKSWSEVRNPKGNADNPTITQLSNFAIAPVPNFVNIPLLDNVKKLVNKSSDTPETQETKPQNHDDTATHHGEKVGEEKVAQKPEDKKIEDEKPSKADVSTSKPTEIKQSQPKNIPQESKDNQDNLVKKNIDLLSEIKPSKKDNNKNSDKRGVIDIPYFLKNNRQDD
ncbi:hypothetical protein AA637_13915 [Cyanobacterium sp. HL-69]|uniref:hypothetical protein n=1 Tax=Cyanobacterium sp. HL-69 TaxID=2054282 RepID=UPI000CA166C6|nr:hypothetical protein AA637_13915 [Cyanobacterium sp. HL-69]